MTSRAKKTRPKSCSTRSSAPDLLTPYARDVLSGKIPAGRLIRLACQRHRRDLKHAHKRGFHFDVEKATRAIRFLQTLRQSEGEWANRPLVLAPWQHFLIWCLWGWRRADGTRRFRTALVLVARKNGKSTLCAALTLLLACADGEPAAEVYCGATKKKQSREVFDEAKRMARKSPAIRARARLLDESIEIDATNSKIEPVANKPETLDGSNPHAAVIDEFAEHTSRDLLDVFDTGMGARRQPLLIAISTAGQDVAGPCGQERDYAMQVLDSAVAGEDLDDEYFALIYEPDPDDDPLTDETCWVKANPNLDVTVKRDKLRSLAKKASLIPAAAPAILRKNFNLWVAASEKLIQMEQWRGCPRGEWSLADLAGRVCYAGFDGATRIDIAALVLVFPPIEDDEPIKIVPRFWVPEDGAALRSKKDRVPYTDWIRRGLITATPGNAIDHDCIRGEINDLRNEHALRIESVYFDPHNATQLAGQLEHDGFTCVQVFQGFRHLADPTDFLLTRLASAGFDHGGHEVLAWMAGNCAPDESPEGYLKPSKKKSREKIDGIAALVMAILGLLADASGGKSIYDQRGITSL